ncbi:hypothetical protein [Eisenbergiella sp.]
MAKTGAKNLQIMKKIVLSILRLIKESYKISMKRIRYELSLGYENEVERMFAMLDIDTIKEVLRSNRKFPEKIRHFLSYWNQHHMVLVPITVYKFVLRMHRKDWTISSE